MAAQFSPAANPVETRAIAKEAYIYGFPLVDSYRIQNAYFIDKAGPEYKVPYNQIALPVSSRPMIPSYRHPTQIHPTRLPDWTFAPSPSS